MRRRFRALLLLAVLVPLLAAGKRPSGLGDVMDVRVFDHATHTRLVIELSRPATYTIGSLGSPPRLYVDIEGVWIDAPLRKPRMASGASLLALVRGGQNTLTRARIVVELRAEPAHQRSFELRNPDRIVVDLYPSGASPGV